MFNNNSFGDRLKELRKSKKLTQVQVSEMIDVQQGTWAAKGLFHCPLSL